MLKNVSAFNIYANIVVKKKTNFYKLWNEL